ncbi:MAG: tetratricopeptide repeat protein [Alphaproteobacteria bacterium]|nr:tetratricopeptide repeat protein [Alphaproteobacteria bacterium]
MVRLRSSGGRLIPSLQESLDKAAQACAQGALDIAEGFCRIALELSSREPVAFHILGLIAQQRGDSRGALRWFDAALTVKPNFFQARFNRAVLLRGMGHNEEAFFCVRPLLESAPLLGEAWDLAGQILKDKGKLDEAKVCFEKALALQPGNALFHGNYGLLLFALNDLRGAYREARQADLLNPSYPPLLLGNVLRALGYPEEAARCFARARTLMPDSSEARASEAMALLQMGDLPEGFALWEQRPDLESGLKDIPLWQGEKTTSLLLYEDQGLGDAIQFLRYIPLLKKAVSDLVLRVRAPLVSLCAMNFPDIHVLAETEPLLSVSARCRLSSLPFFFHTALSSIPPAPYITAPTDHVWAERLAAVSSPRIGLVWAGNTHFRNDAWRSIELNALSPLWACGKEHFVSLQKDSPEPPETLGLADVSSFLSSFADTAAIMTSLDLIVSVDTASAHLAGALGKPVFVLLPFNSDWRWLMAREDSPWYPSARLFRQEAPGEWTPVLERVADALKAFINGDPHVRLAPPWKAPPVRKNPFAIPL